MIIMLMVACQANLTNDGKGVYIGINSNAPSIKLIGDGTSDYHNIDYSY